MNREQMVEKAAAALLTWGRISRSGLSAHRDMARAVLDAILPQITTVAELEALPVGTWLIGSWDNGPVLAQRRPSGVIFQEWACSPEQGLRTFGPLTVVWQPQDQP